MKKQPAFYSLDSASGVDFWALGGDAARRTFIMPLPNPFEFLAFGVLSPSEEVLFAARGQVLHHLGDFVGRMAQAGASVELYERVPLPGSLVAPLLNHAHGPYPQNEADQPPTAPNLVGEVSLLGSMSVMLSSEPQLWTLEGSERKVIVTAVPDSSEFLAFGMVKVDLPDYLWKANFVARLESNPHPFLSEMKDEWGATVELRTSEELPETWKQYMATSFPQESLAASITVARLGPAKSGGTRLSLG
jgi:hypothetical protein